MTTVYFIRHGTTDSNVTGRFQGSTDVPLGTLGCRQAEALAEHFKDIRLDAVYSSPLSRARQTAEAVCRYQDCQPILSEGLAEVDGGYLENRTNEENERDYPGSMTTLRTDPAHFAPPGGESGLQVWKRVRSTVHQLVQLHEGQTIAVVSHGFALMTFLGTIDCEPEQMKARLVSNASVTTVNFVQPDYPVMQEYNSTEHLPEEVQFRSRFWKEDRA